MVFGRLRSLRHSRGERVGLTHAESGKPGAAFCSASQVVIVLCLVTSLLSCQAANEKRRAAAFASSLEKVDESIRSSETKNIDGAFAHACRKAGTASNWLSILKRAESAGDAESGKRLAAAAARAHAAFPRSMAVNAAAAHAYLRSGRAREALAMFGTVMPADTRPELWAEAFVASKAERDFEARPSDYARLAEAMGDPRPFLGAAAASLGSGDRLSASAWLEKAVKGGASAPIELLWDCGLYAEILERPDAAPTSVELELMGDTAWKTGDIELAKRRWTRAIALGPKSSWRPYANLALLSGTEGGAAENYWLRLKSAFLSDPPSAKREEALCSFAAHLARTGQEKEALAVLRGGGNSGSLAVLGLAIRASKMTEEKYAIELERLAAQRPDDSEVMSAALRELARRGMYAEVVTLREGAARRKLPLKQEWFYAAATLAARGDYKAATSVLKSGAGGSSSAEGSFALGSLLAAMGEHGASAREYSSAAAAAHEDRDRCKALKALGRELAASGDAAGAMQAFKKASVADPSDSEAVILARGTKK
jgi:tetratricopeptide (TPR) repeat protein